MAEASAPRCLAPSCHIAHSNAEDAEPHSHAAAQLIQAGLVCLWKSEARLALSRRFARHRGPDGASEPTRHARLASVPSPSRKRKATMGVNTAVMKSPSVPMKHARVLQQPPALNVHCNSVIWGSDLAPNHDDATLPPLLSPQHEGEAELEDMSEIFQDLKATTITDTAAVGAASPVMDAADIEGLLDVLLEVELQVDMLGTEYGALWPAGPFQAS
eukprot:SM000076S21849  [mRNA]  locus=s76:614370:615484:+ [translate_table: standard]